MKEALEVNSWPQVLGEEDNERMRCPRLVPDAMHNSYFYNTLPVVSSHTNTVRLKHTYATRVEYTRCSLLF